MCEDKPYDEWGSGGVSVGGSIPLIDEKKWNKRFLDMAHMVAQWSKDPSTKVGAVLTRQDRSVVSVGYNGFPRGCADDEEHYEDRELKYARTVHAEMNCLLAAGGDRTGHTIYTTNPPCCNCAAAIVQCGIRRVVYPRQDNSYTQRWHESISRAHQMMREGFVLVEAVEWS